MITRALFILILFSYALNGHAACSNNIPSNMSSSTPMCGTTKTLSSGVNPANNFNIMVPKTSDYSLSISGYNFSSLIPCPSTFACPDINGKGGTSGTPSCPDACIAGGSGSVGTSSYISPTCPSNYYQVGSYGSVADYFNYTTPNTVSPTSTGQMSTLQSSTPPYTCSQSSTQYETKSGCDYTSNVGAASYSTWSTNQYTDQFPGAFGTVVQITGVDKKCYWSTNYYCNNSGNTLPNCPRGTVGQVQFTVKAKSISCVSGTGIYPTGKTTAAYLICIRHKPAWAS